MSSFMQCYRRTGDNTSAVFINLNLVEAVYMEPIPSKKLYNVKIRVGGIEYDMFDDLVDSEKASNSLLQVTGLKGKGKVL